MGQLHDAGIFTYSRALVYAGGIPREKGIDVRISLDIIRLAMKREYDVALLFSQDQDLSEVAKEIREVAREQQRWIKIASALPMARDSKANQGVNFTDWLPIDRQTYDPCIDPRDYRPRSAGGRPTD
ncbi:MAG: hypothetical protein GEEBNDBF_02054 [bacterium]|nr:hypothetical protein [bacterium]